MAAGVGAAGVEVASEDTFFFPRSICALIFFPFSQVVRISKCTGFSPWDMYLLL